MKRNTRELDLNKKEDAAIIYANLSVTESAGGGCESYADKTFWLEDNCFVIRQKPRHTAKCTAKVKA